MYRKRLWSCQVIEAVTGRILHRSGEVKFTFRYEHRTTHVVFFELLVSGAALAPKKPCVNLI